MKVFTKLLVVALISCANAAIAVKKTTTSCTTSASTFYTSSASSTAKASSSATSSTISSTSSSTSAVATGIDTNGLIFDYPYPVNLYNFTSQKLSLQMAYMDVSPSGGSVKGAIVLLHGKFFCGATWNQTIITLVNYGYRVIVPDQIGFCKSTKPVGYQFTLSQLALNTNGLLQSLNVTSATIMGHSMGGMLSVRYSLMYPSQVNRLVMVDPLGLENWFQKGVPYQAIDVSYKTELATTFTSIQTYENTTYYSGQWNSTYDIWVQMLLDVYTGSEGALFAYNMAQTTDMIFTQPIVQELGNLSSLQSMLLVGNNDNTALGKAWAPAAIKPLLGNYELLGQQAHAAIGANNTLVEFPGLGHAPHIEDPTTFFAALLSWLP
jgi:pimeloyl-ACP methyl ester carboxylesterase